MNWEKSTIGEHCEITSSKRIFYSEYVESGVPFYRSKEIIEKYQGQAISEPLFISRQKYIEIKNKFGVPQSGDLLLTSVGTIGIPYIVKYEDEFYFKDGNLTWFRKFDDKLFAKYLYYWILSTMGKGVLLNSVIGSSQKALTIAALKTIRLSLPPIETQKRIADILSAYDYLIENNQKQIKLLEEAAQRLYKEWVIDLHFPGYETTPIVNGIPEGWKYIKLQDFSAIVMGQSPKSEYFNSSAKGLPFHQGVGSYGFRFVRDQIFTTSLTKIANAGNILFSVRAPVGRLNITQNKIVIGRGLAALDQKYGYQSFLFYTLKEHFFKDNIIGNGSIFASISKDELASLQFLIPTDKLVKSFEDMVSKYDAKIKSLDNQISLLTEARDRLLPKLMSGEIEV